MMKRGLAFVAVCILTATLVVVWRSAKESMRQKACLDSGGKWATTRNDCITPACAKDGSCMPGSRNNTVCSTLKTGIGQDELFFHLGMPESSVGHIYTFTPGGDGWPIEATIIDGVVMELHCGA